MNRFNNEVEKFLHELQKHIDRGVLEFKMPYGTININLEKLKQELTK
jgi:hypothetical protein